MDDNDSLIDNDELDTEAPGVSEDEDELKSILRTIMAGQDKPDAAAEEDVFALEPVKTENPAVSLEEGMDLIQEADRPKPKADTAPKADDPPADDQAKPDDPASAAEADPAKPAAPAADIDALLTGIDAERASQIRERISAAEAWSGLVTSRGDYMARIGENPQKAVENLLTLHEYANTKPDEYLAWAAHQLGGDKMFEVMEKAAAHMGLKIVRAEEDDPFDDPATKALREENAALRAKVNGGKPFDFGPEQFAAKPVDPFDAWKNQTGANGQPLRPLWNDLEGIIGPRALAMKEELGRPLTFDDLGQIYDAEVARLAAKFGAPSAPAAPAASIAAPSAPAVASNAGTKPAAADPLARAKAASKHIDGEGQGADRHSASPPENASVAEIVKWQLEKSRRT